MAAFYYPTGQSVQEGDIVTLAGTRAFVERVLVRGTRDAHDYACSDTGGILLKLDDGNRVLERWIDEDIEFHQRGQRRLPEDKKGG